MLWLLELEGGVDCLTATGTRASVDLLSNYWCSDGSVAFGDVNGRPLATMQVSTGGAELPASLDDLEERRVLRAWR